MNSVMRIFRFALLSCLLLQVARSADDDLTTGQARITDFIKTIRFSKARLFVYSLDPNDRKIYSATLPENSDQVFHRYPILGKIEIVPKLEKEYLLKTFAKGVKQGDTNSMPRCFEPRVGLRIVTELTTNDLVACYTCTLVKAYGFNTSSNYLLVPTSNYPKTAFDRLLDEYHIVKAKQGEDK